MCSSDLAWRLGWIDDQTLERLAQPLRKSGYGAYLLQLLADGPDQGTKKRGAGLGPLSAGRPAPVGLDVGGGG